MPTASIRQRVRGILRTTFTQQTGDELNDRMASNGDRTSCVQAGPSSSNSFISHCLLNNSSRKKYAKPEPEIYSGKTGLDLPLLMLEPLSTNVRASYTGPDGGLTEVECMRHQPIVRMANLDDELSLSFDGDLSEMMDEASGFCDEPQRGKHCRQSSTSGLIGSCSSLSLDTGGTPRSDTEKYDWRKFDEERCFGISTTLYERNPLTGVNAGHPIADAFGVVARENSVIMALADGVNWGQGACLAARCAVRGAIDHLNYHLFNGQCRTTTEVFHELLGAFHSAHALILQEDGSLTTLCVAVAIQLRQSDTWALCVCNVGDSLCFVYNPITGVREVTVASHDICQMRDMRDAGGALGPVDGTNPQLHNLTCSMTFIEPDDVIFITSDGVSDNFDPVVGKFCVIKRPSQHENLTETFKSVSVSVGSEENGCDSDFARTRACNATLPCVDAEQRHELMLLRMGDIIANGIRPPLARFRHPSIDGQSNVDGVVVSASAVCHNLIQFAQQLSMAKRRTLEDPELYQIEKRLSKSEQRNHRKMVRCKLSEMPGKLDHASVVAFKVGIWSSGFDDQSARTSATNLENGDTLGSTTTLHCDHYHQNASNIECHHDVFQNDGNVSCAEITCDVSFAVANEFEAMAHILLPNAARQHRCDASASLRLDIDKPPVELVDECRTVTSKKSGNVSPYEEIPVATNCNGIKPKRKHPRGSVARHTLSVDVAWLKKIALAKNSTNGISHEQEEQLKTARSSFATDSCRPQTITLGQRLRNFMGSARNAWHQHSGSNTPNIEYARGNPPIKKIAVSASSSPCKKPQVT